MVYSRKSVYQRFLLVIIGWLLVFYLSLFDWLHDTSEISTTTAPRILHQHATRTLKKNPIPQRHDNGSVQIPLYVTEISQDVTEIPQDVAEIPQDVAGGVKVLLVTYFRGGSTFLGEAFNRNPDAFYWFEPLKPEIYELRERTPAEYKFTTEEANMYHVNGSVLELPQTYVERQVQNLADILNCRLDHLDKQMFKRFKTTLFDKSLKLVPFKKCIRAKSGIEKESSKADYSDKAIEQCLPDLIKSCKNSGIKAVKTIRTRMYMIPRLLELDPSIKVVYYIRDPRAMRMSMSIMWNKRFTQVLEKKWSTMTCARMFDDHVKMEKLKQQNISLLTLKYEDLAMNVETTTSQVYTFLGLEVPQPVVKWYYDSTHAHRTDGVMGTVRKNSLQTATNWKRVIKKMNEEVIMENCQSAMQLFGYNTKERFGRM